MSDASLYERIAQAAEAVRDRAPGGWEIGLILGSGLGGLAERIERGVSIPYGEIPHFPGTTVSGHAGRLVLGELGGRRVAALQGRVHAYEGHDLGEVTFPVRVLRALGAGRLILTAAAGGIREDLRPGDLVCLSDHINLLGGSPLRGGNDTRLGPRFPDMSEVYSAGLRALAQRVAEEQGIGLRECVYAGVAGPQYETPAEVRMLRVLGGDVVGMSTVPEAIAARHGGMEVLGFAVVTNLAAGVTAGRLDHEEVLRAGLDAGPRLGGLIEGVIRNLPFY
jgi:purine-nucleoside phosphorylase